MAKDPAFLFYSSDFLVGTYGMSNEEVGQYIRLLCLQHQNNGKLTQDIVESVGIEEHSKVLSKFKFEDGFYFNERLLQETEKRTKFSESRRNNRLKREENKKSNTSKTLVKDMLNTSNNNDNKELNQNKDLIKEIIQYLNEKTNKNFRYVKKTSDLITARINEKFTLEDFKTVIDNMTDKWLKDNNMNQYLRPETLFGTKFESYLNVKTTTSKNTSNYGELGRIV